MVAHYSYEFWCSDQTAKKSLPVQAVVRIINVQHFVKIGPEITSQSCPQTPDGWQTLDMPK